MVIDGGELHRQLDLFSLCLGYLLAAVGAPIEMNLRLRFLLHGKLTVEQTLDIARVKVHPTLLVHADLELEPTFRSIQEMGPSIGTGMADPHLDSK